MEAILLLTVSFSLANGKYIVLSGMSYVSEDGNQVKTHWRSATLGVGHPSKSLCALKLEHILVSPKDRVLLH